MTNANSSVTDDAIRFPSLQSLRAAHGGLLKRFRASGITPEIKAEVADFIRRGKATGALLDSDADRWAGQSELDYWATQLFQPGHESPDATLDDFDPQLAPEIADALCPYMGLDAFHEANQAVFFGRGRLIGDLAKVLKSSRFLAVLGSSGSGKSSLVRAGLIPYLKKGAISVSDTWIFLDPIVPGSDPLTNLARLVMPQGAESGSIEATVNRLRKEPDSLPRLASERFNKDVVLVVDQFEEVFTLCTDEVARNQFVDHLINLCQEQGSQHRVIITMRSDFESNVARLPRLQAIFDQNAVRITSFGASELREVIEAPAALIGLRFEEGVVDALLSDILGEPAALPLLQFTLLKLWENRERNRITWATYRKLGGGRLALARSADEFYNGLIHEDQVTMRRILLKMVKPGEGLEVTSNRVPRAVLYQKAEASDRIDRVLKKLIKERLVRVSEGDSASDEQVEIAHEALVRNWPRLVEWLDEERDVLRHRQRLTTAAHEWQRLNRATSTLWRRELLNEALRYDDLNDLERQFVNASNSRQQRNRIAWVTGVFAIIAYLVIAVLLYRSQRNEMSNTAGTAQAANTLAVAQQVTAQANENEARRQTKLALASRLASQAQLIIETQKSKQAVGVLLAIRSMQMNPSAEAAQILRNTPLPVIVARMDHAGEVTSVAYSQDGLYVVSGGDDGAARVWEVATGKEISRMMHDDWVTTVTFSPDGQYVISGSSDGTARVWDPATGNEAFRITHAADGVVRSVSFSPDGKYVASGGCDMHDEGGYCVEGTVHVWEVASGKEIFIGIHDLQVNAIDFSPDGEYVVSGSDDGTVQIWEVASGTVIAQMRHDWIVTSVVFSPDGQFVASGSYDSTARVWEVATGNEIVLMMHDDLVSSVDFSPDGRYIASGSFDGKARVWEVATGTEIARVTHGVLVLSVAFSLSGQQIISGSDDGIAILSDAFTGETIASMSHDGSISSVAFSTDGRYIVSGGCERLEASDAAGANCFQGNLRVWGPPSVIENVQMIHEGFVYSVAFSPNSQVVVSGSADGTARVWEVETGKEIARARHDGGVSSVGFSPDGRFVVWGSYGGIARVWEVATGNETLMRHGDAVNSVAFSPDGLFVVSGSSDRTVLVWEVSTGNQVALMRHGDTVNSVAFSPDGLFVVSGSYDGTARVWEVTTGNEIAIMRAGDWVNSVGFSPDGRFVVSGSSDGTARVWEVATRKEIARMNHGDSVNSVAFGPDGLFVVSGSYDGTALVWEVATEKEIARATHDGGVSSAAFSPDGQYVVSGGYDGIAQVWEWQSSSLTITRACSRLTGNLTITEWKQYFGDEAYQAICPNLPTHLSVVAEAVLPILLNANDLNRVQTATAMAGDMFGQNLSAGSTHELATRLVKGIIDDQITRIYEFDLQGGDIEPTLVMLENAKTIGLEVSDSFTLNRVCWFGSIYGYAKEVLQYCELAVTLAPDDAGIRDSRGLARALTGDYAGAIEDFQFFVDSGEYDDDLVKQRRDWIKALKTGIDPFTPDVLEILKGQ